MQKSASIAYFEAICSFWRTYYWCSLQFGTLKNNASRDLQTFVRLEDARLKSSTPDIGAVIPSYTVFQNSLETPESFIDAYLDEFFLRQVMWWKKAGTPA